MSPAPPTKASAPSRSGRASRPGNTSRPSGSRPRSRPSAGRRDQNRPSAVFARRTSLSGLQSPRRRLHERVRRQVDVDVSSWQEPNLARHTIEKEKDVMKKVRRFSLLVVALIALASMLALHAAAGAQTDGNRLEASFTESAQSVTNRIADLGTFQLINTGAGTVDGFGSATVVVGITQDRSVAPCGTGSWTNAATRRIVLADGVLMVRELSTTCSTPSGLVISGTYEADGLSSTGIFAGARGTAEITADPVAHTATLSGK